MYCQTDYSLYQIDPLYSIVTPSIGIIIMILRLLCFALLCLYHCSDYHYIEFKWKNKEKEKKNGKRNDDHQKERKKKKKRNKKLFCDRHLLSCVKSAEK